MKHNTFLIEKWKVVLNHISDDVTTYEKTSNLLEIEEKKCKRNKNRMCNFIKLVKNDLYADYFRNNN